MDIRVPGTDIPDTLAALDWREITCQSAEGCSNLATHIVHVHMVDDCDDPNLDSCGNTVDILCAGCLRDVLFEALQHVGPVQTMYTSAQFTNVPINGSYNGAVDIAISPAPVVSLTENNQSIGGVPISLLFSRAPS